MVSNRDPQQIMAETFSNLDSVEFLMAGMQKIIKILRDDSMSVDSKVVFALSEANAKYETVCNKKSFEEYGRTLENVYDELKLED